MAKKLPPVHPGEILREEFLVPLKLTPYAVAAALNVPRTRIERIAREEKPVTADTALRLGKFFKTGAAFWRLRVISPKRQGVGTVTFYRLNSTSPCLRTEKPTKLAGLSNCQLYE